MPVCACISVCISVCTRKFIITLPTSLPLPPAYHRHIHYLNYLLPLLPSIVCIPGPLFITTTHDPCSLHQPSYFQVAPLKGDGGAFRQGQYLDRDLVRREKNSWAIHCTLLYASTQVRKYESTCPRLLLLYLDFSRSVTREPGGRRFSLPTCFFLGLFYRLPWFRATTL